MVKIKGQGFTLNWEGDQVVDEVVKNMKTALGEFGLMVESEAKQELQPGHGVLTGTLRRSIHTAPPDYNWASDDVEPGPSTPERGGILVEASKLVRKIAVSVGSGLNYALPVHQGHGSFAGYHYLIKGLEKAKTKLKGIVERHKV